MVSATRVKGPVDIFPGESRPFIELHSVGFQAAGVDLLKDVDLTVCRGEIVAIMGPSGQGKSLLLKIMAGLLTPTAGKLFFDGKTREEMTPSERDDLRLKTGMLFQQNALFDSMTVLENVSFPQVEGRAVEPDQADAKSRDLLKAVGLLSAAEQYPSEVSGGMQKRLGIARALALSPEVILYDDPTAGLDPITSRQIIELIKGLQVQDQSTVFFITNEVARAMQAADKMGFMFGGRFVFAGSPEQAAESNDPRISSFLRGLAQS